MYGLSQLNFASLPDVTTTSSVEPMINHLWFPGCFRLVSFTVLSASSGTNTRCRCWSSYVHVEPCILLELDCDMRLTPYCWVRWSRPRNTGYICTRCSQIVGIVLYSSFAVSAHVGRRPRNKDRAPLTTLPKPADGRNRSWKSDHELFLVLRLMSALLSYHYD